MLMVCLLPLALIVLLVLAGEHAFADESVQVVVIRMGLVVTLTVMGGTWDVCRAIRSRR